MKNVLISFLVLFIGQRSCSQYLRNISFGERLTYRIHYGILTAGTCTLSTQEKQYAGLRHMYVLGRGSTSGFMRTFFKVEDRYETYINLETGLPSYYIRNVKEGNYTQNLHAKFDKKNEFVYLYDKEKPEEEPKKIKTVKNLQDMLSAFYYLRSFKTGDIKVGDIYDLNVWIDKEIFPFRIKIVAEETIKTQLGRINCLKIMPQVKDGRVFKNKESVIIWVSNDANYIPISVKAELLVGSLKADLSSHTRVKYPLKFSK
ncbi:MAG: DUF3108 domain-containing protein [Bergeyella sp.]|nr:DUF3108 domain-containing protein [Bergeyella sp.]